MKPGPVRPRKSTSLILSRMPWRFAFHRNMNNNKIHSTAMTPAPDLPVGHIGHWPSIGPSAFGGPTETFLHMCLPHNVAQSLTLYQWYFSIFFLGGGGGVFRLMQHSIAEQLVYVL